MLRLARNLCYLLLLVLAGCSQTYSHWDSEAPYAPPRAPQIGDIVHTATGHYINQQQLFSSLSRFPLVYVGEVHDNPASHRLQLEILKAMQTRHPGEVVLGMEMFNSLQQPALDQWVAGELSEKAFLRKSRWFANWGYDYELYRELLEYCRDQRIPVIGLNVPAALAAKVSMTPLDKLEAEVSEQLPEMDMSDRYHSAMIEKIFSVHQSGSPMVESFLRRQTLWDETMAAAVTGFMLEHPDQYMVIVAGGGHVEYGFGIPRRVHRRLPLPYALVGGHNLHIPDEKLDKLMDVRLPEFPMRAVDYLVYQEYEVFRSAGVRLGVVLDDSDDQAGVLVTDRVAGSAAAQAGISKGDRLLLIDSIALEDSFDLIYALRARRPGDSASITLKRAEQTLVVEVYFIDSGSKHP